MVTDSKEVFFEQVQLTPAVRDKVNSMIDSGLFLGIVMVFISGFIELMIFLRGHWTTQNGRICFYQIKEFEWTECSDCIGRIWNDS